MPDETPPPEASPEQESVDHVRIRFAGDSGDGMQVTGSQFTNTSALLGNDLATFPDFPAEIRAPAGTPSAPNMPFSLVEEFCRAVASNLRANIHVELLYGRDGHHIAEAVFKGLARALRDACERDPRVLEAYLGGIDEKDAA